MIPNANVEYRIYTIVYPALNYTYYTRSGRVSIANHPLPWLSHHRTGSTNHNHPTIAPSTTEPTWRISLHKPYYSRSVSHLVYIYLYLFIFIYLFPPWTLKRKALVRAPEGKLYACPPTSPTQPGFSSFPLYRIRPSPHDGLLFRHGIQCRTSVCPSVVALYFSAHLFLQAVSACWLVRG